METSFFKRIRGFKTLGLNALVVLMGLGTMTGVVPIGVTPDMVSTGTDMLLGGAETILGGVNIFLRMITSTKVGKSE